MRIVYSVPITISPVSYNINRDGEFTHNDIYCMMQSQVYEQVIQDEYENTTEYLINPDRYVGNYYIKLDTNEANEKFEYWFKDIVTLYKFPDNVSTSIGWIHLNPIEEITEEEVKEQINKLYEDIQNSGYVDNEILEQHFKIVEDMVKEANFET